MTRFRELDEFEARFPEMDLAELRRWRTYWARHAELLAPRVRKLAMKRVHRIDAAIARKLRAEDNE
jgi:hypothetical protein